MPNGTYWWCERTGKEIIFTFLLDYRVVYGYYDQQDPTIYRRHRVATGNLKSMISLELMFTFNKII